MNTFTETVRRLRAAAQESRKVRPIAKNWRVEVGVRQQPVIAATRADAEVLPVDDDLDFFMSITDAARHEEWVRTPGAVVHLYFSSTGDWGQLEDVMTVWLRPDGEAEVLFDNGRRVGGAA